MAKFRVAVQDPPDSQSRRHLAMAWAAFLSAVLAIIGGAALWSALH